MDAAGEPRIRRPPPHRPWFAAVIEVHGSERDAMWRQLTDANRYLERVSRKAGRRLPVLVLAKRRR